MAAKTYEEFLEKKNKSILGKGIKPKNLNEHLKDFQALTVERMIGNARYGNFSGTGMGKTIMELAAGEQVAKQKNVAVLHLAPLAVAGQTILEGEKFGIEIHRLNGSVKKGMQYITNYDQLDNIDPQKFGCVILDESSILKNFNGETKKKIISAFKNTHFKFPCTATPSPNDPMELGNHFEFLNIMSRNEMLAMYFVHDGGDTAKWRIKKHGKNPFYQKIASFATIITKPSDLGFSDAEFILPPLNIIEKKISTENKGLSLFNDIAVSAIEFNHELRITMKERLTESAYLSDHAEPVIIWVKQNEEADYMKDLLPDAVDVRGSMSTEEKEEKLLGFARGEFRVLITKAKIAQYGLNFQICNNQIFPSLDFSFESLFQAIRRSWRYGQKKPVNINILSTDTMSNVIAIIKQKEQFMQQVYQVFNGTSQRKHSFRFYAFISCLIIFNCAVVLSVNGAYIYITLTYNRAIITVSQIGIALFKLFWNSFIVFDYYGHIKHVYFQEDDTEEQSALLQASEENSSTSLSMSACHAV